jgi:hypothetical protein
MKLRYLTIQNYKSLRNLKLEDIPNFAVFMGKNSSGKSNVLEAIEIVFSNFDGSLQRTIGGTNDYLWFDTQTSEPVRFDLGMELSNDEITDLFEEAIYATVGLDTLKLVNLTRVLRAVPPNLQWETEALAIGQIRVVESGKFCAPPEISLKTAGGIAISLGTEAPPPGTSLAFDPQTFTQALAKKLQVAFKLVPANRDRIAAPAQQGQRQALLDDTMLSSLAQIGQSVRPQDRRKWGNISHDFEEFAPFRERLESVGAQIFVAEPDLHLPLASTGGGTQGLLNRPAGWSNHCYRNEQRASLWPPW